MIIRLVRLHQGLRNALRARRRGPTLTVAARDPEAGGPAVVGAGQIEQDWHAGSWSVGSITLPDVRAGDAIVVAGVYWGDLRRGSLTAPADDRGELAAAVDQGPSTVGVSKPPVFAQIYFQLAAAPGRHVLTPPDLGGVAGDGTFYALQIRGLKPGARLRTTAHTRVVGTGLPDVGLSLGAGTVQPGDLLVAVGGNDNVTPHDGAGFSDPPAGWTSAGAQQDAATNVPSEICHKVAGAGAERVSWSWTDPAVNVAVAAVAAFG